jgi:NADH-quinone oxidoreductase subunit G
LGKILAMPKLTIDNRVIEVPEGTKVIEAAERLGIMIPRFCYHPALGSVGACRVCAVKFVEGPVKGIEMSCMQDARDGMVVSTTDPEAMAFRKYVIEWLMLNHPLDCPVCDEGGHCLLQDETVSGSHGIRRYLGKKRTYYDQYLGEFVQHEMNRCIHCFRCRRFYQDFAGYRDLGAMQIGNRMYFGRFSDGPLESPFSGNLIDVCPTGVYTDKPARFKGRRWNFERSRCVCLHCSLGCNTTTSGRYREVMRQEARVNETVNGHFICDRGRFGFDYANRADRPREARVEGKKVSWDEGVRAAAEALTRISEEAGPQAIACLGSTRSSLESQTALKRFCRLLGWREPWFFVDPMMEQKVKNAVGRLDERVAISMGEIENADFILGVGADPVNEAPMLALALRQAFLKGATVALMDPRPVFLPFEFEHLPVAPGDLDVCLGMLIKNAFSRKAVEGLGSAALKHYDALPETSADRGMPLDRLKDLGRRLKECRRPVFICGSDIVRESTPELVADHALLVTLTAKKVGLFYLLPGPNAFGAGLLSAGEGRDPLLEAIESDDVKALLLVENDPFHHYRDRERLSKALDQLELFIAVDYLPSPSVERAHIFLPSVTIFERVSASFVNQEGRLQSTPPLHRGGVPIAQISEEKHPPRTFLDSIPGGDPRAVNEVLSDLALALSGRGQGMSVEDLWIWLARKALVFRRLLTSGEKRDGVRLVPELNSNFDFRSAEGNRAVSKGTPPDHLELLVVDRTFGTEELSGYSKFTQKVEEVPQLVIHPEAAGRLGLAEGNQVILKLRGGKLELFVKVADGMAPGVMILPRHRDLAWQQFEGWPFLVPFSAVERV